MDEQPRITRRNAARPTDPVDERPPTIDETAAAEELARRREQDTLHEGERRTLEVREEQLVPRKEWREVGEVRIRKEVEQVAGRMEVDALREEVEIEHVPVGEVVEERRDPWQEEDTLIIPVYEERLVLVKRLVLKEQLRVRRRQTSERHVLEEPLLRERAVIDDGTGKNVVQERTVGDRNAEPPSADETEGSTEERDNPLERLARKLLE